MGWMSVVGVWDEGEDEKVRWSMRCCLVKYPLVVKYLVVDVSNNGKCVVSRSVRMFDMLGCMAGSWRRVSGAFEPQQLGTHLRAFCCVERFIFFAYRICIRV